MELGTLTTWQTVGGPDRNIPCPAVAALPPVEENNLLDINLNAKVDGKPRIIMSPGPFRIWRRRVTRVADIVARVARVRSISDPIDALIRSQVVGKARVLWIDVLAGQERSHRVELTTRITGLAL